MNLSEQLSQLVTIMGLFIAFLTFLISLKYNHIQMLVNDCEYIDKDEQLRRMQKKREIASCVIFTCIPLVICIMMMLWFLIPSGIEVVKSYEFSFVDIDILRTFIIAIILYLTFGLVWIVRVTLVLLLKNKVHNL